MKQTAYKLPGDFLQKLKNIYPNHYTGIVDTFFHKKEVSFRINYLKADLATLRRNLVSQRVKFKELAYPQGAFLLKTPLQFFYLSFL